MRKTRKWLIISAVLALCITACASLFVGCVDTNDEAITYTVSVQTDTEAPASGVKVQLRKGGSTVGDAVTTGTDGKAVFEAAPDDYTVRLTPPQPYSVPQGANLTLTKANPNLTVKLQKDFVYTVKLVKPNGDPFYAAGVSVGICTEDSTCLTPVDLGTNGVAIIKGDPATYHVKVNSLPANYRIETDEHDYYAGADNTFTATKNEMTITVYEIVNIDLSGTAMTAAEKTAYAQNNTDYDTAAQAYDAFKGAKQLAPGDAVYFSVTTAFTGKYGVFFATDDGNLKYTASWSGGSVYNAYRYTLDGAMTYYFKAENIGTKTENAEFVFALPFSSYVEKSGTTATANLKVGKENTVAIIAFIPEEGGTYTLSVKDGVQAFASVSTTEPEEVLAEAPTYTANATAETEVTNKVAARGSILYFAVTVKADSYPANVNVEIKKTADSEEAPYIYAEVKETLTQYTVPEGKELYGIPMDGTAATLVKGTDGFYHYGTADGPVVVVNITGAIEKSRYDLEDDVAILSTLDTITTEYQYVFTEQTDDGEATVDYQLFLRGFTYEEYEIKQQGWRQIYVAPSNITTETYYAKYVNKDGMYPLTEELKSFLEKFYETNKSAIDWVTYDAPGAWMFPLYYYGEPTPADVIVGEYKFVKFTNFEGTVQVGDQQVIGWDDDTQSNIMGPVTADTYKLVVTKQGAFTISKYNNTDEVYEAVEFGSGTWKKSESGVYTFTVPEGGLYNDVTDSYDDLVFTVTFDNDAGTLKLEGNDGDDLFAATVWEFARGTQA